MAIGLLGTKVGMTQVYTEAGDLAPVTVLQVGPCTVLQVKAPAHGDGSKADGYHALQLGYLDKPRRKATKAESGHVSSQLKSKRRDKGVRMGPKADCEPKRYIREVRLDGPATHAVGAELKAAEVFQKIKKKVVDSKGKESEIEAFPCVDVIGFTKGRGFQGVVKRHGYGGLRQSHGVKKGARQRGSMGSNASNRGSGRPKKGIKMAGRYGNEQVTVRNLDIVSIDAEKHLVLVKGAVPGHNGGIVMIRPTNKR
jgi:large subunit ribosomal protein L3